jgi:ABC-type multidrug transport system ATPase subunit
MNAITVTELTRRFGDFLAVDHLTFEVRPGEIFGLLGSNGAGKSTTIRMLCGLLRPTGGTAEIGGVNVVRDPEGVKRRSMAASTVSAARGSKPGGGSRLTWRGFVDVRGPVRRT